MTASLPVSDQAVVRLDEDGDDGPHYHLNPTGARLSDHSPLCRLVPLTGDASGPVVALLDPSSLSPAELAGASEGPLTLTSYDRCDGRIELPDGQGWSPLRLDRPRGLPPSAQPLRPDLVADLHGLPTPAAFEHMMRGLAALLERRLTEATLPEVTLKGDVVWFTPDRLYLLDAGGLLRSALEDPPGLDRSQRYGGGAWQLVRAFLTLHLRRLGLDNPAAILPLGLWEGPPTLKRLHEALAARSLRLDEGALRFRQRAFVLAQHLRPELVEVIPDWRPPKSVPEAAVLTAALNNARQLLVAQPEVSLEGPCPDADAALNRLEQALPPLLERWVLARRRLATVLGLLELHVRRLQAVREAQADSAAQREQVARAEATAAEARASLAEAKGEHQRLANDLQEALQRAAAAEGRLMEVQRQARQMKEHLHLAREQRDAADDRTRGQREAAHAAASVGIVPRALSVVLDLGLVAALAWVAGVLSGAEPAWTGDTLELGRLRLPAEALALTAAAALFARSILSPGRALLGLTLVLQGRGGACEVASAAPRLFSALFHYTPPMAAGFLAAMERARGRAVADRLASGLPGQFGVPEWAVVAGAGWLVLLGCSALLTWALPVSPLRHSTTWVEWLLGIGVERYRFDRLLVPRGKDESDGGASRV